MRTDLSTDGLVSVNVPCGSARLCVPKRNGRHADDWLTHAHLDALLHAPGRCRFACRARSRISSLRGSSCSLSPTRGPLPGRADHHAVRILCGCARLGVSACRCSWICRHVPWDPSVLRSVQEVRDVPITPAVASLPRRCNHAGSDAMMHWLLQTASRVSEGPDRRHPVLGSPAPAVPAPRVRRPLRHRARRPARIRPE
jgi:hypothetical protein